MSTTRDNAATAGAELLAEHATDYGQQCGMPKELAAVQMLERALAIAWSDVFMFQGANPSPDRLQHVIEEMQRRLAAEVTMQALLRRGHNANYGKPRP